MNINSKSKTKSTEIQFDEPGPRMNARLDSKKYIQDLPRHRNFYSFVTSTKQSQSEE